MADSVSSITYLKTAASLAFDALREGRLPLSPRRWLIDLRHLRASMAGRNGVMEAPPPPKPEETIAALRALVDACQAELVNFIGAGAELRFVEDDQPIVSVVLVLHNRAELTLRCLKRLRERLSVPFELVIVDNGSTDDTEVVLRRLCGVTVLPQSNNLGFLRACNLAAQTARGTYLLFLNNDTEIQVGAVEAALETLARDVSIGVVGGRLVLPDGRLQEAGSIIWSDGSCAGYGRGDWPEAPQYSFSRDVDYCSAAFMLTPRQLFADLGGFDDRYQPAYYEDVDYCVRVWKANRRVVYDPRAVVQHVEFASSSSATAATAMQLDRRTLLVDAHRDWLAHQPPVSATTKGLLRARDRRHGGQRILFIDDRVPHEISGFGDPRALAIVRSLVNLGHSVSLCPTAATQEEWTQIYEDLPRRVEVLRGYGTRELRRFLREHAHVFDTIIISRSHNMKMLRAKLGEWRNWAGGTRIVYDAEAITAARDVQRRRLRGDEVSATEAERLISAELSLARGADAVFAVSPEEARQFEAVAPGRVHVVGHGIDVAPTTRPFRERSGIVFVGAFHELSPNADAVLWFISRVWPILRKELGDEVCLTVAGQNPPWELMAQGSEVVRVLGAITDLKPLYDHARVFVAPTRFASGIPIKVIHAAAHGVPAVVTSLLAHQLQWESGRELLAADSVKDFASAVCALYREERVWDQMRAAALGRVRADYSMRSLSMAIEGAASASIQIR